MICELAVQFLLEFADRQCVALRIDEDQRAPKPKLWAMTFMFPPHKLSALTTQTISVGTSILSQDLLGVISLNPKTGKLFAI